MPKVLIGAGPIRNEPGPFRDLLTANGLEPLDPPGTGGLTEAELGRWLPESAAIVAGGEPLTAAMIAESPGLRVIARTGVGYDAVDVAEATARDVVVAIAPGTNQESVAEQAFGLLLALTRNVVNNDRTIHAGGWDRSLVRPLRGQTLGLVGMGRIGRAMVPRALAFGLKVVAFDTIADADFDARHGIRRLTLDDLLAEADIVSLHLPLMPGTRHLFDRERFRRMRPGSILLNTARGGLVDEAALVEALEQGPLAGAGLDVLDPEPPAPGNPLMRLPNVVISPHVGGIDTRAMADMAEKAAWVIAELYQGRWPADCIVNPEVGPGWSWTRTNGR